MESIHILFLLTFLLYVFLWIVRLKNIQKKSVIYVKKVLMFIILPPFWMIFLIMVLDVNLPIVPAKTEQVLVLDNTGNDKVKCIVFEKFFEDDSWKPAYRLFSVRHTPFIELNAGAVDSCRFEATSASHIFACATADENNNLSDFKGKIFAVNYKPIDVKISELLNSPPLKVSGISFSHEINRLIFFIIAIMGIWLLAVSLKDSAMKYRAYAVAAAVTILSVYLSVKFIQTINLLSQ